MRIYFNSGWWILPMAVLGIVIWVALIAAFL